MTTDQEPQETLDHFDSSEHDGDFMGRVTQEPAVAPVMLDHHQHYATVIQHLGIEIANRAVNEATIQAKVALALQAYSALHIDTWVRQIAHEPALNGTGETLTIAGPIVIPPDEHEALSRFLAAVEALR